MAVVITAVKVMDIILLAMMGMMECKDFVKAQGRLRSTEEGLGEGRTTAKEAEAHPTLPLAMDTRVFHQTNQ